MRSLTAVGNLSHSLRGLCGLKSYINDKNVLGFESQPARAVWIEIASRLAISGCNASQPARAVWIEMLKLLPFSVERMSQPARAVWIEILSYPNHPEVSLVTACEGCVD